MKEVRFRKIRILKNGNWKNTEFFKLKKGDMFRVYEVYGDSVIGDNDKEIFTALTNAYQVEESTDIKVGEGDKTDVIKRKVWYIDTSPNVVEVDTDAIIEAMSSDSEAKEEDLA